MESIEDNYIILIIIFLMMLGAFIIGYFFGNSGAEDKIAVMIDPIQANSSGKSKNNSIANNEINRVEIADVSEPGQIRATKTRERAGKLSEEVRTEMASKKVDFSNIGSGDPYHSDDFKKIIGIGSFVEEKLNTIGIYNYSQLAKMTDDDIRAITKVIEFFPGRIHRDDWKGQAMDLMKETKV